MTINLMDGVLVQVFNFKIFLMHSLEQCSFFAATNMITYQK